jgi:hypothetical protein
MGHGAPLPHPPDRPQPLPKIRQLREPEPSTINEKTVADFTRVVEQTGILMRDATASHPDAAGHLKPSEFPAAF